MPILTTQRRARELGRIRLGQKGDRGQPQKLDRFRFTSNSQALLQKVADLYGGQVHPWEGGTQAFEVVSDSDRLPIMVPPQPISQWHEAWRKSGCIHRCDGSTNVLTDEPCDPDDPAHVEALDKPTTRLNVVLRDVEGIGVWRVETKGWHAATEIPDAAEFLAFAGGYVNGWLSLDPREDHGVRDGKPYTHRYQVPIIEIDVTPAQLMAGEGRVATPSLEGPVPQTPAIEAPKSPAADVPDYLAQAQEASTVETVGAIWRKAAAAGHLTDQLAAELKIIGDALQAAAAKAPEPDAEGVFEAEVVDETGSGDEDAVWQQIVLAGGQSGMTTSQLTDGFAEFSGGVTASTATAAELQAYLEHLRSVTA